jgi:hypothetical protein
VVVHRNHLLGGFVMEGEIATRKLDLVLFVRFRSMKK